MDRVVKGGEVMNQTRGRVNMLAVRCTHCTLRHTVYTLKLTACSCLCVKVCRSEEYRRLPELSIRIPTLILGGET